MIVTKNLSVSTIEVDLEGGTIWVNGPNCKLRISNLTIPEPLEDFSMIDIVDGKATMYPKNYEIDEDGISDEMAEFLIFITNFLHSQLKSNRIIENRRQFLSDIKDSVVSCVREKYSESSGVKGD